jgi:hypothetical protein
LGLTRTTLYFDKAGNCLKTVWLPILLRDKRTSLTGKNPYIGEYVSELTREDCSYAFAYLHLLRGEIDNYLIYTSGFLPPL